MKTRHLYLGHGLNLKPLQMQALAKQLCHNFTLLQLSDHASDHHLLNASGSGHWQRWCQEADRWVADMDENSCVLAYSLSAPLIMHALERAQKRISHLALLSPALFFRYSFLQRLSAFLPDTFPVPSFSQRDWRCASSLPLGMYRELAQACAHEVDCHKIARHVWVGVHAQDEVIDADKTQHWTESQDILFYSLTHPQKRPYHAAFQADGAPIQQLRSFFFSTT